MFNVVFMGTPDFALPSLQTLHQAHRITGVYTQPDKPMGRGLGVQMSAVKTKALELSLPIFQPQKLNTTQELEKLQSLKPDVIVVVAYGKILRPAFLQLPPLGCINIHSSLLPRWRGAAPIQSAILAGDAETGVSTMQLVEELDAGDVLLQKETPISSEDTAETLHDRLSQLGAELILATLEGLQNGSLKGKPQSAHEVTFSEKLTKEMEWLNPQESAEILDRRIRALNPWPGTSVQIGQRLKIKKAKLRSNIQGIPGKIFERSGMLLLGTAQGSLELLRVQWEGKKETDCSDFLNALRGRNQSLPLQIDQKFF